MAKKGLSEKLSNFICLDIEPGIWQMWEAVVKHEGDEDGEAG